MKFSFPPFVARRRRNRVLCISEDAFVCCCPGDEHTWKLHYLLRGSFGNYLLGGPPFDERLASIAEGIGGIAKVLPFDANLVDDAARWFTRFGCRWIVPIPAERLSFGRVPVDSIEDTVFIGLTHVECRERDRGYSWGFRWRDATVAAGFPTEIVATRQHTLALPHALAGRSWDLDNAVVRMQASLAATLCPGPIRVTARGKDRAPEVDQPE